MSGRRIGEEDEGKWMRWEQASDDATKGSVSLFLPPVLEGPFWHTASASLTSPARYLTQSGRSLRPSYLKGTAGRRDSKIRTPYPRGAAGTAI